MQCKDKKIRGFSNSLYRVTEVWGSLENLNKEKQSRKKWENIDSCKYIILHRKLSVKKKKKKKVSCTVCSKG